jgi:hypothetical protein
VSLGLSVNVSQVGLLQNLKYFKAREHRATWEVKEKMWRNQKGRKAEFVKH